MFYGSKKEGRGEYKELEEHMWEELTSPSLTRVVKGDILF